MSYCRFCGQELVEGQHHVCAAQNSPIENGNIDMQYQKDIKVSVDDDRQQVINTELAKEKLGNIWDTFLKFMANPVGTLKVSYHPDKEKDNMMMGVVYAFVIFFAVFLPMMILGDVKFGESFKVAFWTTVLFVVIKLMFVGIMYLELKNKTATFKGMLAITCLATIPQTVCVLGFVLCCFLGFPLGIVGCLILFLAMAFVMDTYVVQVVTYGQVGRTYWVYIIYCVAVMLLFVILGHVGVESLKDAINDFVYDLF